MPIARANAIVLKTWDFRETSLIANFYTKEFGKLRGLLKGIRKEPKKFASTLEAFSCNEIIFYQNRNNDLHLVSQCDLINSFNSIRNNLTKFAMANYAVELIDSIVAPEDKNEDLFLLLVKFLEEISNNSREIDKLLHIFQIKVLDLSGFKPNIESCISCKKHISDGTKFSYREGGLLCSDCCTKDRSAKSILKGTIASLTYIGENDWENLKRFKLNADIQKEIKDILENFISFHLETKLKSSDFLEIAVLT